MATCNICKYAGTPSYKSPCSECKDYSKYEYEKPKTNADRIRAMSDEELAEFLVIIANDEGYDFFCDNPKRRVACRQCKLCIMEWLKQPAEEDTE